MANKEAIHAGKIQSISWASCLATIYVSTFYQYINNKKIIHWFFNRRSYTSSDVEFKDFSLSKTPLLNFKDLINYFYSCKTDSK